MSFSICYEFNEFNLGNYVYGSNNDDKAAFLGLKKYDVFFSIVF